MKDSYGFAIFFVGFAFGALFLGLFQVFTA
jgi:hypothetical protein